VSRLTSQASITHSRDFVAMRDCVWSKLVGSKSLQDALIERATQILRGVDGTTAPAVLPTGQALEQSDKYASMVYDCINQAAPLNLAKLNIAETANDWAGRAALVLPRLHWSRVEYTAGLIDALGMPPVWVERWLSQHTIEQLTPRMMCKRWLSRWLRTQKKRCVEHLHILAGFTGRGRNGVYCSKNAVKVRREQKAKNEAALKSAVLSGDSGQQMTLYDVSLAGLGHKPNRRAEVMTRIGGLEAVASKQGRACMMVTITCPSRMHPNPSYGGLNAAYDGTTPKQASEYLNQVWARSRTALKRAGLVVYGMRASEPHKDGCPHWHIALWYDEQAIVTGKLAGMTAAAAIEHVLRVQGLRDSPNEAGADTRRVHISHVQRSAAGYVAKYVAKLTDGHSMTGDDCEGTDSVASTVERADAWASHWAVRAFQFYGTPSVSLWRTVRKIKVEAVEHAAPVMRELWTAAVKDSDYGRFTELLGGGIVGKEQLIVLDTERVIKQTKYDGEKEFKKTLGVCLAVSQYKHSYEIPRNTWDIVWSAIKAGQTLKEAVGSYPCPRTNNCTKFEPRRTAMQQVLEGGLRPREQWNGEYPPW